MPPKSCSALRWRSVASKFSPYWYFFRPCSGESSSGESSSGESSSGESSSEESSFEESSSRENNPGTTWFSPKRLQLDHSKYTLRYSSCKTPMDKVREKWNRIYSQNRSPGSPSTVLTDNLHLWPSRGTALDLACGLGADSLFLAARGQYIPIQK